MDRLVNACEGSSGLDRAIETMIGLAGRFNGQDVTNYLEIHKDEMLMIDIPEDRRLSRFPRVVTLSIHAKVLEVQVTCRNWREFEDRLLERYGLDGSFQMSKKELMEWVELPKKETNTSTLLLEFEEQFAWMLALDRTMIDMRKVLFIKLVDPLDREKVGHLLEIDEGLAAD